MDAAFANKETETPFESDFVHSIWALEEIKTVLCVVLSLRIRVRFTTIILDKSRC